MLIYFIERTSDGFVYPSFQYNGECPQDDQLRRKELAAEVNGGGVEDWTGGLIIVGEDKEALRLSAEQSKLLRASFSDFDVDFETQFISAITKDEKGEYGLTLKDRPEPEETEATVANLQASIEALQARVDELEGVTT